MASTMGLTLNLPILCFSRFFHLGALDLQFLAKLLLLGTFHP